MVSNPAQVTVICTRQSSTSNKNMVQYVQVQSGSPIAEAVTVHLAGPHEVSSQTPGSGGGGPDAPTPRALGAAPSGIGPRPAWHSSHGWTLGTATPPVDTTAGPATLHATGNRHQISLPHQRGTIHAGGRYHQTRPTTTPRATVQHALHK